MFDISWGELLLIGVVALIVIGPKELPSVLRTVGQWMTKLRRMANEFQGQFQEAIREAEMADLKKEVDDLATQAKSYANFDPIGDVQKEIEDTIADKPAETAVTDKPAEAAATAATAETPANGSPAEIAVAAETATARTPADAAVESAMRAAAELNAPMPDAGGDFTTPQAPAAETVAPRAAASAPAAEAAAPSAAAPEAVALPAAAPEPPAPATPHPAAAPVAGADDDWPVPASFKEPLGPKRNAGSG